MLISELEQDMKQYLQHIPVMVDEVIDSLQIKNGHVIVDGTIGLGGHAEKILERIGEEGRVIGIDRDADSLAEAKERLNRFSSRIIFAHQDFRHLDDVLLGHGIDKVDGIFFDLGISSYQLDNAQRGFSLQTDGPLDMRMDKDSFISAYDLVNSLSEQEIASILRTFGEERFSYRIARFLVQQRSRNPISSTHELTDTILKAVPASYRRQKIHPATRTFQAFRIAVNRELEALEIVLDKCCGYLKKGGRLCVLSFHSLEDRIVKNKIRYFAGEGLLKIITKKPLRPDPREAMENPRSRSARLRAAEKI